MDRRRFLRAAAAAGIPVTLAGCTGDGDDGSDGGATPTATDEPTDTPTATDAPTDTPTDSPTATDEPGDTPTATDEPTDTPTETPTATDEPTPTPEPDMKVDVGPDGRLRFDPETFSISAGDTVLWIWRSGGHNVKPGSIPSGSDWSGSPGGGLETYNSGYRYSHTFEVTGEYSYKCNPHQSSGMRGSFTVE